MHKIIAFIPARKGSKGLKNKNFRKINGKSLLEITINSAKKVKIIDNIYISTDSRLYESKAKKLGVKSFGLRKKKLSGDFVSTYVVLNDFLNIYKKKFKILPEIVLTLQPTSPLRTHKHINESLKLFLKNKSADSLVSCVEVPHNFNPFSQFRLDNKIFPRLFLGKNFKPIRRQDKKILFSRNGAIYITRINKRNKFIFGGKQITYLMKAFNSIDINTEEDLNIAKKLI